MPSGFTKLMPRGPTPEQLRKWDLEKDLARSMLKKRVKLTFSVHDSQPYNEIDVRSSELGTGRFYRVNVPEQTCECAEYQFRKEFPPNHLGRLCKHLYSLLFKEGYETYIKYAHAEFDALSFSFIRSSLRRGPIAAYRLQFAETYRVDVLVDLPFSGEIEWIRVADGSFVYGWNIAERRWSYGEGPSWRAGVRGALRHISGIDWNPDDLSVKVRIKD